MADEADLAQVQIDAAAAQAIRLAQRNTYKGESLKHCEECGTEIPEARRVALPGVRMCVDCLEQFEKYGRRTVLDEQFDD